jgi:UDP-N-acetyl-D-glucosamine dehydrogenase
LLPNNVVICGLGYVGLPLALAISKCNFIVTGYDIDSRKIEQLNSGKSPLTEISDDEIKSSKQLGNFFFTNDHALLPKASILILCVPTPLDLEMKPDLSFLYAALSKTSNCIDNGTLIIIESTVSTGMTRLKIFPFIQDLLSPTKDNFLLSYSPERIDPTNKFWGIINTPKLVSGLTDEATVAAKIFYSEFISEVVTCNSLEIAETAKLLENSFRLINISFINEISAYCQKLEIDVNQVISAAKTKPYGFLPFYPSIGIGGHCIPIDPLYLAFTANSIGAPIKMIDLAAQINQEVPRYFARRALEILENSTRKKVLVVGVAYKPNVSDVRETPVETLITNLRSHDIEVFWHDDLVKEWNGENSVALSSNFDLAILATPHDYLDLTKLGDVPILNTRGSI